MQTLHIFDAKNYNPDWLKVSREAVRAIIIKNNMIALVRSQTEGFYKFPGGGIEQGESHISTLIRETQEETGLHIIPQSVIELGIVWEIRKGLNNNEIFEQKSYYYNADVKKIVATQNLSEDEKRLAFELAWVDIETAYKTNAELEKNNKTAFIQREAYALKYLLDHRK